MTVGERIKIIRGEERQSEFAEKLGLHKNTIGRWERDESVPNIDNLEQILKVDPNINPSWLITGEGEYYLSNISIDDYQLTDFQTKFIDTAISVYGNIDFEKAGSYRSMFIKMLESKFPNGAGSHINSIREIASWVKTFLDEFDYVQKGK